MKELGNLILLLDDEHYSEYKVKILIVGVPGEIRDYFRKIPHEQTVANRLQEIPEVSRLDNAQVNTLVTRGFIEQLKADVDPKDVFKLVSHIAWVTDGIPQRIHEYCEQLAYIAEKSDFKLSPSMLDNADWEWLHLGLANAFITVKTWVDQLRDLPLANHSRVRRWSCTLSAWSIAMNSNGTTYRQCCFESSPNYVAPNRKCGRLKLDHDCPGCQRTATMSRHFFGDWKGLLVIEQVPTSYRTHV